MLKAQIAARNESTRGEACAFSEQAIEIAQLTGAKGFEEKAQALHGELQRQAIVKSNDQLEEIRWENEG